MNYISTKEAAEKWGVSLRYVQRLLHEGRISGARKYGVTWLIPAFEEKPPDLRQTGSRQPDTKPRYKLYADIRLRKGLPSVIKDSDSDSYDLLVRADMAHRRGDMEPAKAAFRSIPDGDETKLTAAMLATSAAVCSGDYPLYYEIQQYINNQKALTDDPRELALLSLPGVMAAVSMITSHMTPEWLKNCDFSLFTSELIPFLLYLHALYLRNSGDKSATLASARAALLLCTEESTFTWIDINNNLLCASSCYDMGLLGQAEEYYCAALSLAMPYGVTEVFAEYFGQMGNLPEKCIGSLYPGKLNEIRSLWEISFINWMSFHNTFTRENIATELTAQEYSVARIIAGGATYRDTAAQLYLSAGRVKNILSCVYSKLNIGNLEILKSPTRFSQLNDFFSFLTA